MKRQVSKTWIWMTAAVTAATLLAGCSQTGAEQIKAAGAAPAPEKAVQAEAVQPEAAPVTLPLGTALKVRIVPTLSTTTHAVGDTFQATLSEPLVIDGRTVAPEGARAWGEVVEADKGGRVQGRARIGVQLTGFEDARGDRVDVSTTSVVRLARATKKKDAEKVGIGAGIGAAIGAIAGGGKGAAIGAAAGGGAGAGTVLATRGAPAVFPSETVVRFALRHPVTVS